MIHGYAPSASRQLTRVCLFVALVTLVVGAMAAPAHGAALRVDQLEFDVSADPGETVALSLQVQNIDEVPTSATVYTGDWHRLPEGEHLYLNPGTLDNSASEWIRIAPSEFQLDPNERTTLRFTITVPESEPLEETRWSMLFIESSGQPAPGGSNVRVVQRVGVKIYVTPRGELKSDGVVERVEAKLTPEGDGVAVSALFKNTGEAPLEPGGVVRIVDATGQVVAQREFSPFPVLPGDSNFFRVTLPAAELKGGRYAVIAALDYGAAQMVGGQAHIEIPSDIGVGQ